MQNPHDELSVEELDQANVCELPGRDLLLSISLLGIPLLGLDGVTVNVDTTGPGWLVSNA